MNTIQGTKYPVYGGKSAAIQLCLTAHAVKTERNDSYQFKEMRGC